MGDEYSHAHAACLAAQLPKGARCLAAGDPHAEWDDATWMLWRIERNIGLLRWGFVTYDGEDRPAPFPYPGQARDERAVEARFEANKRLVEGAFNMDGGEDGD